MKVLMVLFLFLLCHSLSAQENLTYSADLWGTYLRSKNLKKLIQQSAGAQLRGKWTKEALTLKAQSTLYAAETSVNDSSKSEADIDELQLVYSTDELRIVLGQQQNSWGKADGLNPTDVLTAKRQQLLVPQDNLRKKGQAGLAITYYPTSSSEEEESPWSIDTLLITRQTDTDLLTSSSNKALVIEQKNSERAKEQPLDMALKINYLGEGVDADLIIYEGRSRRPLYKETSRSLIKRQVRVTPYYPKMFMLGGNFSKDMHSWVLKNEWALEIPHGNDDHDNYLVKNKHATVILGGEWEPMDEHRITEQVVWEYYLHFKEQKSSDPFTQGIQTLNKYQLSAHQRGRFGNMLRYSYDPINYNQWSFELFWLRYVVDEKSSFFSPKITYKDTDHSSIQLFGQIYGGGENTPTGQLKNFNAIGIQYFYQL